MRRDQWWPLVRDLAEEQGGLFTAAQARSAGARRPQLADLLHNGTIDRVQHGIYRLTGTPHDPWAHARAAWLALDTDTPASQRLNDPAGPGGVLSHSTAARILNLGDLNADRVDLTTPTPRTTRNPDVLLHTGGLTRDQWTLHAGLPVTRPEVTVASLAATGTDLGHLATIARDAALKHDVSTTALAAALHPHATTHGYADGNAMLAHLLDLAGAPAPAVDVGTRAFADEFNKILASYSPAVSTDHLTKALAQLSVPEIPKSAALPVPNPPLTLETTRVLQRHSDQVAESIDTTALAHVLAKALKNSSAVDTLRELREQLANQEPTDG